jgi:hypothetical protein
VRIALTVIGDFLVSLVGGVALRLTFSCPLFGQSLLFRLTVQDVVDGFLCLGSCADNQLGIALQPSKSRH